SQGALVALELALTGDPAPAIGVIAVAPSFPPPERLPDSTVTLNVEIVYNAGDLWGRRVPVTAEALRSRGHRVTVEELPGLGHDFPHDFAERLPVLLRRAREGVRAPPSPRPYGCRACASARPHPSPGSWPPSCRPASQPSRECRRPRAGSCSRARLPRCTPVRTCPWPRMAAGTDRIEPRRRAGSLR